MNRAISSLRRRLERWELGHLRAHAADLAERLEKLEHELNFVTDRAEWLERSLHDLNMDLAERDLKVGLTKDGQIGLLA